MPLPFIHDNSIPFIFTPLSSCPPTDLYCYSIFFYSISLLFTPLVSCPTTYLHGYSIPVYSPIHLPTFLFPRLLHSCLLPYSLASSLIATTTSLLTCLLPSPLVNSLITTATPLLSCLLPSLYYSISFLSTSTPLSSFPTPSTHITASPTALPFYKVPLHNGGFCNGCITKQILLLQAFHSQEKQYYADYDKKVKLDLFLTLS